MSVLTLSTRPPRPRHATGGTGVLVTTGGAVTRVRLTGGCELAPGHRAPDRHPVLDRLVLSQSPALDMWFDQAGFLADVPVINRMPTAILRALPACPVTPVVRTCAGAAQGRWCSCRPAPTAGSPSEMPTSRRSLAGRFASSTTPPPPRPASDRCAARSGTTAGRSR